MQVKHWCDSCQEFTQHIQKSNAIVCKNCDTIIEIRSIDKDVKELIEKG